MPNYVVNIVKMRGIAKLPLFSEEDGEKAFDFNKLIPLPAELKMEAGSMTERSIVYFLTERCTIPIQKLDQRKAAIVSELVTNMFRPTGWPEKVFDLIGQQMSGKTSEEQNKVYEAGRQYVSNYEKYGFPTWYEWCINSWGSSTSRNWSAGAPSGMQVTLSLSTQIRSISTPHGPILSRSFKNLLRCIRMLRLSTGGQTRM